jgi:hypothetical protein
VIFFNLYFKRGIFNNSIVIKSIQLLCKGSEVFI